MNTTADQTTGRGTDQPRGRGWVQLLVVGATGILSGVLYLGVSALSEDFHITTPLRQRPIPLVVGLLGLLSVLYLIAGWAAARAPQNRPLLGMIFIGAVVFRAILLPTQPIQEIDIYRYLWDGRVITSGISPYRYPPLQIRYASVYDPLEGAARRLVQLRNQDSGMATVLGRIHYAHLPSVYPPVSQFVFAAATLLTPESASIPLRMTLMKLCFVGFDLGTLLLVIRLLRDTGLPMGLSLLYGWCPLLLKEVANSGHLDAVAVFLTTLAVWLCVQTFTSSTERTIAGQGKRFTTCFGVASMIVLALAVGAKLYPIVLAPILVAALWRRGGWRTALASSAALAMISALVLWPMFVRFDKPASAMNAPPLGNSLQDDLGRFTPPSPADPTYHDDPSLGLTTFLRTWEMNDFLFLIIVENLKPDREASSPRRAWFAITPNPLRQQWASGVSSVTSIPLGEVAFLTTRVLTLMVYSVVGIWLVVRCLRDPRAKVLVESSFLMIAWFWLLSPTQNPWYWTWALPFLPFARSRVWWILSGLVLIYYLRFWYWYVWPDGPVIVSPTTAATIDWLRYWLWHRWVHTPIPRYGYDGRTFFDFVITWVEFAPWFAALAIDYWWRTRRCRGAAKDQATCV